MNAGSPLYNSRRVAAGYAFSRPAVHTRILQQVREHLHLGEPVARALDVGCGAGRSTAALEPLAQQIVGLDPAAAMMEHRRVVAPGAQFVLGQAERLPFADAAFDLIAAAGAINYADLDLALPEIARVLSAAGTFVIYDFSAGRRFADGAQLERWYAEFERRYPDAPGYEIDVTALPFERAGLMLERCQPMQIPIPMTRDAYFRYATSETRVELAISAGADEGGVREWCRVTLQAVFDSTPRDVIFDAYAAYVRRPA